MVKLLSIFYGRSTRCHIMLILGVLGLLYGLSGVLSFSTLLISVNSVTEEAFMTFLGDYVLSVLFLLILNPQTELWYMNRVSYNEVCRLSRIAEKNKLSESIKNLHFLKAVDAKLPELDLSGYKINSISSMFFLMFQATLFPLLFLSLNVYGMTGFSEVTLLVVTVLFGLLYLFSYKYNQVILKDLLEEERLCLMWEIPVKFYLDYLGITDEYGNEYNTDYNELNRDNDDSEDSDF